jgi:phosphoribosylformimino-5-aminoimidazole carboxamide ribotide isomerase
MILFPAIDLKDGQCVRLKLGEMDSATVYNEDPAAQALAFEDQGFEWLHVVDLNGAFEGQSVNGAAVEAILKATRNPVQLGGGIRTLAHIEAGSTRAWPASFWAPLPCAIPIWSSRPAGFPGP